MNAALLMLTPLLPLLMAPWLVGGKRDWWMPLAVLPAIVSAVLVPVGSTLQLPWLLLGVQLVLDPTAQLLLLFSALVWFAAAVHAAALPPTGRGGFAVAFLMAMAGNFLLLLAADVVTFYLGFALMGLSAYGMLVDPRSQRARRAARVYLGFTLLGEVALFSGIVMLVADGGSILFADLAGGTPPPAAVALLLLGFGIKVALPGLHVWLPLAYTAAPVAAVAVLSGPMMKAGLLGWLRFLPPGAGGLDGWGSPLIVVGAFGIVLGVSLGVLQRTPRALLAYSSIAKMGLITALFGSALAAGRAGDAIVAALLLFAIHHLLVKSTLFLAVGEWERRGAQRWLLGGSVLLALSMVGAPLTAGAAAKQALADALAGELGQLLLFSAVGTAVLMIRFIVLLAGGRARPAPAAPSAALAWLGLLPLALWAPFAPGALRFEPSSLLPIALGLLIAALAWLLVRRRPALAVHPAPGDLVVPAQRALQAAWRRLPRRWSPTAWPLPVGQRRSAPPQQAEATLLAAGLRWLVVVLLLLATTVGFD